MSTKISAKELPVKEVFSAHYSFEIPPYQRPYSWTKEQAGQLFDDLKDFAFQAENFAELKPYFLGSLVLIKSESIPQAQVIDGQQRLTTLTILLSALRDALDSDELTRYIYEKGDEFGGIPEHFRVKLRERDNEFFKIYIQREGNINNIPTNTDSLTDSQVRIAENANFFVTQLKQLNTNEQKILAMYILQKCYLVLVATEDEESAFRIFSVLNDRGLQLSHADILKADIIGKIEPDKQEEYTKKWEDLEEELGTETFKDLFGHIRMVSQKSKAKDSILKEIREKMKPDKKPKEFIDKTLIVLGNTYSEVINETYRSINKAKEINNYFNWLKQINNRDWVPPTISYIAKYYDEPEKVLNFLRKLERLAFGLWVLRTYATPRIERYANVLRDIEEQKYAGDPDKFSSLSLEDTEKTNILETLNRDVYNTQFCKYLLLRLDAELSDGSASYNHKIITIEHVLPRSPKSGSQWLKDFPDAKQRTEMTNCIGNLVLLSRKRNSSASNYEFEKKKEKYFRVDGVSAFVLTTQVLNEPVWTPQVVQTRHRNLISKIKEVWDLT